MIARVEYRGCVFSIKSQLGTKQKGAFIEGVHLWRVYLWRVDCTPCRPVHPCFGYTRSEVYAIV